MIESMNLISVPLPLPDVLSSLSTGIIDAAYAPPLGILSLQWNTKVSHLIDFPLSYSIGAFLIGEKAWKKISPENQKIVLGGSSGINIAGAIKLAKKMGPGKTIVTILCDHGKRYASKIFNKEFLESKNLPIPKWL